MRLEDTGARRLALRGAGAGILVGAVVLAGRVLGILDGPLGLALAGLLLVAVPVARSLSRRLVVTGAIVLGWLPVLWWVRLPVGGLGRVTIGMALLAAGLAFWVASSDEPVSRLRRLVPRVRLVDLLPLGAAAATAVLAARWSWRGTGESTLAVLSRGWDHSAHFFMASMIRRTGATLDRLGPGPGGDEWAYQHYPQGFHSVAATIMETLGGPDVAAASVETVLYVRTLAVVSVVCVLLVVAAVTALPRLWTRPWVALPLTVFVTAVLVLGPGGSAMVDGFPNFILAFSLLSLLPALAVLLRRLHDPVLLLAIAGAVIGIAHGWLLLLALAAPAVVAATTPWTRERWAASRGRWVFFGLLVVVVGGAVLYALALVSGESPGEVLAVGGGIEAVPTAQVVVLCGAAAAASLAALAVRRRVPGRAASLRRAGLLVLVPAVGVLAAAAIALVQVTSSGQTSVYATSGQLSYYFFKFSNALAIVAAMVLVTAVAVTAPRLLAARASAAMWLGSLTLTLALTQLFGVTFPQAVDLGMGSPAPGLPRQQDWAMASATGRPGVPQLLAAAEAYRPSDGHVVYVAPLVEGAIHPISAAQWYYALTGTWTSESNEVARLTGTSVDVATAALAVLAGDPGSVVVVSADDVERVRDAAAERGWEDRVRTF